MLAPAQGRVKYVECDLVVAADGNMSDTRRHFLPHDKRR